MVSCNTVEKEDCYNMDVIQCFSSKFKHNVWVCIKHNSLWVLS